MVHGTGVARDLLEVPPSTTGDRQCFRIAIVGGGPRGLYCLQSLRDQLATAGLSTPVHVTIFEPSEFPGAGSVYNPEQPPHLRMNFAAKHVDAWPRDRRSAQVTDESARHTLVTWLQAGRRIEHDSNSFVPRAVVGRYLQDCFDGLAQWFSVNSQLEIRRERVQEVIRRGTHWRLRTDWSAAEFDEVAIAVGHADWCSARSDRPRLLLPAFPTGMLRAVPAGSTVVIRGFGLTWIDVALSLTEGRGGEFTCRGERWRYHARGEEPARVLPFSRTGRPMFAKPDESRFPQPNGLDDIWFASRQRILAVPRPVTPHDLVNRVWKEVVEAAAEAVSLFSPRNSIPVTAVEVEEWFRKWSTQSLTGSEASKVMRHSFAVASGLAMPDIPWGLGAAWRGLYPALVTALSHGGLQADGWSVFRPLAVEMERLAFGPPAENLGRILALIDADLVDLDLLTGKIQRSGEKKPSRLSHGADSASVDYHVNAVLPSPLDCAAAQPLASMLEAGILSRQSGCETISIDRAGRPINDRGQVQPGLAVFGRATEGCVIGNDTLSRKLHDHPRRWAEAVIASIRKLEVTK